MDELKRARRGEGHARRVHLRQRVHARRARRRGRQGPPLPGVDPDPAARPLARPRAGRANQRGARREHRRRHDAARRRAAWSTQTDGRSLLDPGHRSDPVRGEPRLLRTRTARRVCPAFRSLRTRSYRYAEYYRQDTFDLIFREYYDLAADPWELENQAETLPPERRAELSQTARAATARARAGRVREAAKLQSVRALDRPTTPSVRAMPSIPKPRLRRAARAATVEHAQAPAEPRVEVVEHGDLRWINIEQPGALEQAWLEEHFDFHPLDLEDVRSRNQRPKIDEYEDYLFIVLHFPVFDKTVGRLNAGELDIFIGPDFLITLPNSPLAPGRVPVRALPLERGDARPADVQGTRAAALQDRRRLVRLLLPDAAQDGQQARPDRGRDLRGRGRGRRARHLEREAGDHQLPQDHPAAASRAARPRAQQAALPRRGPRHLLRRHRRRVRADLGHARELQGGRRGARGRRTSRSSRTASTASCGCSRRSA